MGSLEHLVLLNNEPSAACLGYDQKSHTQQPNRHRAFCPQASAAVCM